MFMSGFFKKYILTNEQRIKYLRKIGVTIGNDCEIYSTVEFGSEPYLVSIGDHVRLTDGVKFVTHDGGVWVIRNRNKEEYADLFGRIIIGSNVHIGWDAIIMPNVKIGNNVIVGCGAIVTRDIPDNSVAVGVPAKVIKTIDQYYDNIKDRIVRSKGLSKLEKRNLLEKMFPLKE